MVSDSQLSQLVAAHITTQRNQRIVMTAVALAESGGNERAHNYKPSTRDDSYGLWQINMYGDLGPDRRRRFGLSSNDQLYDPVTNAKVAGRIWRASGFTPWSAYRNGKYEQYLDRAEKATGGDPSDDAFDDAVNSVTGGVDAILGTLGGNLDPMANLLSTPLGWFVKAAEWFAEPHNWVRILEVVGGMVLGVVAIGVIVNKQIPIAKGLK